MSRAPYARYVSPVRVSRQRIKGQTPRVRRRGNGVSLLAAQSDLPPGPTWLCDVCRARIRSTTHHIAAKPSAHIVTFTVPE